MNIGIAKLLHQLRGNFLGVKGFQLFRHNKLLSKIFLVLVRNDH
jgi:hypothetical protein